MTLNERHEIEVSHGTFLALKFCGKLIGSDDVDQTLNRLMALNRGDSQNTHSYVMDHETFNLLGEVIDTCLNGKMSMNSDDYDTFRIKAIKLWKWIESN